MVEIIVSAYEDCDTGDRAGVFQEHRACSKTVAVGRGFVFDDLVAPVSQLVAWIRAEGEGTGGFDSLGDDLSDK
jgi:hypothetical protein